MPWFIATTEKTREGKSWCILAIGFATAADARVAAEILIANNEAHRPFLVFEATTLGEAYRSFGLSVRVDDGSVEVS